MPKGRKMSRMKSGDSKAQACSPLTSHALYKLAVTTRIHTGPSTHSSVRRGGSLPPCSGSDSSSGRGCSCIPSLGVSGATCPSPRAPCPPCLPRHRALVPESLTALYLGQGSHYGTFHNASKEDQIQFSSPRGIGEGSQVVQDLLHGWGERAACETHRCQLSTETQTHPIATPHPTAHPTEDTPPGSKPFLAQHIGTLNAWGRGPKRGGAISLACSLGPRSCQPGQEGGPRQREVDTEVGGGEKGKQGQVPGSALNQRTRLRIQPLDGLKPQDSATHTGRFRDERRWLRACP